MSTYDPTVSRWITDAAHRLVSTSPHDPSGDLEPLRAAIGTAEIVGVARGTHGARSALP